MLQPRPSENPIRILLLEDDPLDAELCIRKLELSGLKFTLKNVESSEPFKRAIASNPYDLVLGDFHLPDWTGLDAVRWLRASGSKVPFILITGTLGDELAVECIREGASDYLLKDKLERLPFAIAHAVSESELRQQRDQTERELRQSEKQLVSIVEGSPYGIFRADLHGNILMANASMAKMLGYRSQAEVLSLNMERDIYVNAHDRHEILKRVNAGGPLPGAETKWRCKDGSVITVRLVGRLLEPQSGSPAVYEAFAQDVTEQRLMEQQFQQAQKMEAIGRLAGGVAHDFNNLLMIIRGCAELLNYHQGEPEKVKAYIKQIDDATSIAAAVVQQLMAFSRKQVVERIQIDCNTVLRDLRKMLPRLLGEDIQIEFKLGQNLKRISADRSQIEQIILNLAVNARDAMPHGGKLLISTSEVYANAPLIERPGHELAPGSYVMLTVSDTGTGMPADIQAHIFEPFFTTKERDKGTGLGLATVHGIVKDSGGHILVESTVGKGTTFSIYFPAMTTSVENAAPKHVPIVAGGSETILLVEDEEALREITGEYLRSRGYRILTAKNGLNALEILRAHDEPIDILLTDIIMPGISGTELVKSALAMRPSLRVIYVSGYADRGAENFAPGHTAVILKKPYSLADLGQQIRSAISAPVG